MRKAIMIPVLCGLAALASCDAASAPPAKSSETAGATGASVKRIVVQQLGVEPAKVTSGARFFDDLGADSLDCVELIMAFEEEFGIPVSDAAAEKMVTVGDVVAWLEAHKR